MLVELSECHVDDMRCNEYHHHCDKPCLTCVQTGIHIHTHTHMYLYSAIHIYIHTHKYIYMYNYTRGDAQALNETPKHVLVSLASVLGSRHPRHHIETPKPKTLYKSP